MTALLLFTLSGWAQVFALSALHDPRPAATGRTPASTKPQGDSHAQSHSCLRPLHGSYLLPMLVPALPASLPCDQHPCCVGRDSDNPPSLPASAGVERPGSRIACFDGIETGADHEFALARVCDAATPESYSKLSTVLRI